MCGIAGIFSKQPVSIDTICAMTRAIQHRGPDANAVYVDDDGRIALGHDRLSIIDLSSNANQPMHSADGNLYIVFNGEIYNFKEVREIIHNENSKIIFQTQSDTETILHAYAMWGPNMVNRLDGMFSIVIYDKRAESLFLFRDRVGKKPLFYYEDDDLFVFASEIKGMLKHPVVQARKKINTQAIYQFLHLGYIPQPNSIFESIKKFPAGHWGIKKIDDRLKVRAFWSELKTLSRVKNSRPRSPESYKAELEIKLSAAVQKRLISDVPVGAFLSGGTDSSLVTAFAAQHHSGRLKTFNIGFRDAKFDERTYAERVARHLNTEHETHLLEEDEAVDILENCLAHFDEPFADASSIPTMLVSKLARKQVTVALTGDGGDELFHGYGSYDWALRLQNPLLKAIQTPASYFLKTFGSDRMKRIGKILEKVEPAKLPSHIFSQEQYYFADSEIDQLLTHNHYYESFTWQPTEGYLTPAERQALFDLEFYLKDDLLVKVDIASMFHSLECRCPLLDNELVEFALNLPPEYKVRYGERKWILKETLSKFIPRNLVYRPKWGFSIPMSRWLNTKLKYLIDDYLSEQIINDHGIVRFSTVKNLLERFQQGENHLYNRVWLLIVLHKWLKENML
jgi:asparagine synthase (glutamine-hydrolysing)